MHGDKWTAAELVTDISDAIGDSLNATWTEAQVKEALRQTMREARQWWLDERTDDSNEYDDETFRYDLPPACERVVEIWFEPLVSGEPRKFVSPQSWHQEGEELVFTDSYPTYDGQTMYIVYLANSTNLLYDTSAADGVIASTTTTSLTSATATFTTDGVRVGDSVRLNKTDYDGNGTYYVASITSETALVLNKAPGTAGTGITYYVAQYTDVPYAYIRYFAMAWLYELSGRNKPGRDVELMMQWAAYYRQMAEKAKNDARRQAKNRRRY